MRMKTILSNNRLTPCLVVLLAVFLSGCEKPGRSPSDTRPVFAACIEPHAFLLEKIGGDRIRVEVLVPANQDPHQYEASPNKVAMLSKAKVLFCTGMPFEEILVPKLKSVSADLKIVDLRVGIVLRKLELHSHDGGDASTGHAHRADCSHDGLDPHIWFAPTILKKQAETVLNTLLEFDMESADYYRGNYERLLEEIETTRQEIAGKLAPFHGRSIFVFHPSYGYFCDEFGLRQKAIEFEGKSPKPQQLNKLIIETKKEERPPTIFVQPEFNRAPADAIAEATGGKIIVHSALEHGVLKCMRRFTDEFVAAETAE